MSGLKKPIDLILDKAKHYHINFDYKNEEDCYNKLYAIYSSNFKLLEKILIFQENINSWGSALTTISFMKKLPHKTGLLNKEAVLHNNLNDHESAIKVLKYCLNDSLPNYQTYNLLCSSYSSTSQLLDEGINFFTKSLESDKHNPFINYSLALLHYNQTLLKVDRDFSITLKFMVNCYKYAPNEYFVLNLFGLISSSTQNFQDCLVYYLKSLEVKRNAVAHANLGYLYSQDLIPENLPSDITFDISLEGGHTDRGSKSLYHLKEAIALNSNDYQSISNLGNLFFSNKLYSEAIEAFKLLQNWDGNEGLIRSYYANEDYDNFISIVNKSLLSEGFTNSREISAILSHSDIHIDTNFNNYFCPNPLDYINLTDNPDIDGLPNYNQRLMKDIDNYDLGERKQALLTNGLQASLNLFNLDKPPKSLLVLKDLIFKLVAEYKVKFKDSQGGMFKNWPGNFFLNGWIIRMTKGGFLNPHNHTNGWISGVYYIQVPKKNNPNEGDIKFSLIDPDFPISNSIFPEKEIRTYESRLILFPSSLYHQTIPFSDSESRICIAFDLQPV